MGEYDRILRGALQELHACSSELGVFSRVGSLNLEPASLPELPSEDEIFDTFFTNKIEDNRWAMKYVGDKVEKIIRSEVAPRLGLEPPPY